MAPKNRAYCFTLFDHQEESDLRHFMAQFDTKYWMAGYELCPTTGRQHWQGWMYLSNARSMKSLCSLKYPWHIEQIRAKDWVSKNQAYCSKGGHIVVEGILPRQGARTDIDRARKRTTVREHFEKDEPNFQSIRVLEKKLEYTETPTFRQVDVAYVTREQVDFSDTFCYSGTWHGYDGQTCLLVIVSDVQLASLLDPIVRGLPVRVNVGGSSRNLRVTSVFYLR